MALLFSLKLYLGYVTYMQASEYLISLITPILTELGHTWPKNAGVEPPRDKRFGDMASNCALILAKKAGINPRELAQAIAHRLTASSDSIAETSIAGPGFLNIRFTPSFWQKCVTLIEKEGDHFGAGTFSVSNKIQIEYVSANPTGPLHIGHGRGAAIGDSMARIMQFYGYTVTTEYYINDAGNQMQTLGLSIWLRVLELAGESSALYPESCYKGEYINDIAKDLLHITPALPAMSKEEGIDVCYAYGMKVILAGIKQDLADFRVNHDAWFSELSLTQTDKVEQTLETLKSRGFTYEKGGALWFKTTELGDDKDRVLRKSDGTLTYFASDIAYHANKFERGFTHLIDIWGADHHGYVPRMRAAVSALGKPQENFDVVLVQLVNLLKDGEQVAMSTRAGQFETLHDVIKEVGTDAARFIFLSRKSDSKLDFDLSLVKQRTMDNPVYYVQYAYARICALTRRATERAIVLSLENADLSLLTTTEELDILKAMDRFPLAVSDSANNLSPHFMSYYLMDLAGLIHKYYASTQILGDSSALTEARLRLLHAGGQVIKNGLHLLGVTAPEVM